MIVETSYGGEIDFKLYKEHIIKSIFKILPLREEGKEWQKYLDGLLVELSGFDSLIEEAYFTVLLAKLSGLSLIPDDEMPLFRKTIFDSIDIVKKIVIVSKQV